MRLCCLKEVIDQMHIEHNWMLISKAIHHPALHPHIIVDHPTIQTNVHNLPIHLLHILLGNTKRNT